MSCGHVNIPRVDNNELECDYFVSSKCIKMGGVFDFMKSKKDPSLFDFFEEFSMIIKNIEKANFKLNSDILKLQDEIRGLKTDIKYIASKIKSNEL